MRLLAPDFHVFAVDLRGQGRSSWTPKRYSLDNFGNDLVRFIALVVQRPVELYRDYLGDQWSVGDWAGLVAAARASSSKMLRLFPLGDEPSQNLKEYDPEWARVFFQGTVAFTCPHDRMLPQVKTPVLMTQHGRMVDPETGDLLGALSDFQAERARSLMESAGVKVDYVSAPDALHMMHQFDPPRYAKILTEWAATLPAAD